MVTIVMESFPKQSVEEMGKCFLEAPELPGFMTINGPYFRLVDGMGYEAITIYEFEQSHMKAATDFMDRRKGSFECIEGFNCSMNAWMEPREGFEQAMSS